MGFIDWFTLQNITELLLDAKHVIRDDEGKKGQSPILMYMTDINKINTKFSHSYDS